MRRRETAIALVTALIGLVAGLFPGYGPVLVDAIKNRGLPDFSGQWTGVFKEWCPKGEKACPPQGDWIVSIEYLDIKQLGARVSGTADISDKALGDRQWEANGTYRAPLIVMTYVEKRPGLESAGSYVLKSHPDLDRFLGYWTGYSRSRSEILTCPYVLAKGRTTRQEVERTEDQAAWLQQRCTHASSAGGSGELSDVRPKGMSRPLEAAPSGS
jgi:hypothetical protein